MLPQIRKGQASLLAQEIRNRIFVETGLTASAGISTNKFVAKIASDINKPNGQKQLVQMRLLLFRNVTH
jgi:DNA polymerase-4